MGTLTEAMGLSLPYSACTPARREGRECAAVGAVIKHMVEIDLKPRDILTKKSLHNALLLQVVWVARRTLYYIYWR